MQHRVDRHPHILSAASSLLGICFVIISALKLTHSNAGSYADEIAWLAAILFLACILISYSALRTGAAWRRLDSLADLAFFTAIFALAASVFVAATVL